MKYLLVSLFLVLIVFTPAQAQTIDAQASKVNFHITGGGLFKVKGTFTGMKGDFNFNADALSTSSFDICIDAATVNTKNKKRDAHLREPDFFDVEKYPNICFVSSSVSKTTDGYITKGELTMHGVTKTVEIPFTFKNNTFTGNLEIKRLDYNIGEDYGSIRVGKEATLVIICKVN